MIQGAKPPSETGCILVATRQWITAVAAAILVTGCNSGERIDDYAGDAPVGRQIYPLPQDELLNSLRELKVNPADPALASIRVDSLPQDSVFAGASTIENPLKLSVQSLRQVMVQIQPATSRSDLNELLSDHQLEAIQVLPEIGIVVAQPAGAPTSEDGVVVSSMQDLNQLEISSVLEKLNRDSRVLSATPNSVLSPFSLREAIEPVEPSASASINGEIQDWGIADAHIDSTWPSQSGAPVVGVIDVGFALHEDLRLVKGLQAEVKSHNHGTHVSGIMCAQHNEIDVRGVLRNCTVTYSSSQGFLQQTDRVEGRDPVAWAVLFADYLATVLDFIRTNPDVQVINLSLGYNWLPNYGIDPRTDEQIRNLVRGQGIMYLALLKYAASQDVALISAAGNDSSTLERPLDARWASPFNFGSKLMTQTEGWSNGLVVEAHDSSGRRAGFSNVGGDISCPGVGIISTVASPANSVGSMSGTSMAAPYCAASLMALRNILPAVDLKASMACIRRSKRVNVGVPRLDLAHAIDKCRLASSSSQVEDKIRILETWANLLAEDETPESSVINSGCRNEMRREFPIGAVADLGDGQGPEIVDRDTQQRVLDFGRKLVELGCDEPVLISLRLSIGQDTQERYQFALAIMSHLHSAGYPGDIALVEWPTFRGGQAIAGLENRVVVTLGDSGMRDGLSSDRL